MGKDYSSYSEYQEYWDAISFGEKSSSKIKYLPTLFHPQEMKQVKTSSGSLYVGPLPEVEDLQKHGPFDLIWNLTYEWSWYTAKEAPFAKKVLCANIEDFCAPDDERSFFSQLEEVLSCLEDGGKVFVHCLGGCGRTGTALTCIKGFLDNLSYSDALSFSKKEVGGPELMVQKIFLSSTFGTIQPNSYESDMASWMYDYHKSHLRQPSQIEI